MPCHFPIDKLLSENLAGLSFEMEEKNLYEQLCLYHFNILIQAYNRETLQQIKEEVTKAESMGSYLLDIYLQMIEHQLKSRPLL